MKTLGIYNLQSDNSNTQTQECGGAALRFMGVARDPDIIALGRLNP